MSLHDLIERCRHHPVLQPLGQRLADNGTPLYVVGGPVRDALDGAPVADLDVATAADPGTVAHIGRDLGKIDRVGAAYGVIKISTGADAIDVATFRTERYGDASRNPVVELVGDVETDLQRRDFTINAMAVRLGDGALVDPYGGYAALRQRRLDTPADPHVSFADDPLRIHRAWRFAATRQMEVADRLVAAAHACGSRLGLVARERTTAELLKVIDDPADVLADAVEVMRRLGAHHSALEGADAPDTATLRGLTDRVARLAALTLHSDAPDMTLRLWKIDNVRRQRAVTVQRIIELLASSDEADIRGLVRRHDDELLDSAEELWLLLGHPPHEPLAIARETADHWRQPLAVSGVDVLARFGREPGPWVGEVLRDVEEHLLRTGENPGPEQLSWRSRFRSSADLT